MHLFPCSSCLADTQKIGDRQFLMFTVLAPSILPILLECLITRVSLVTQISYPVESSDTLAGLVTPASLVTPVTLNFHQDESKHKDKVLQRLNVCHIFEKAGVLQILNMALAIISMPGTFLNLVKTSWTINVVNVDTSWCINDPSRVTLVDELADVTLIDENTKAKYYLMMPIRKSKAIWRCKGRHMVAEYPSNACGATCWLNAIKHL